MRAIISLAAVSLGLFSVAILAQQKPGSPQPVSQKPTAETQAVAATAPFPDGARVGYCSLNGVAQQSKEGKASFERVRLVQSQKVKAIEDKTKALDANKALLNSGSLADSKRAALQKEVARQETEIQRLQQDSEAELNELASEMQEALGRRVMPVIAQVAKEKGLHMVVRAETDAILWAEPGLDLTGEIVKRLDASLPASTALKPPAGR
jgi:outer membrane protein